MAISVTFPGTPVSAVALSVTARRTTRLPCDPVEFAPRPKGIVPLKSHPSEPGTRVRYGFTMAELLMVVTIIGIMALLVLPKIRIDNGAVDTAVRTVGMSVMVAQRDAVSRQHNVLVQFDTAGHVVRTIWDSNNNNREDTGEKSRPFLISERVMLDRPSGIPKLGGTGETTPTRLSTSRGPYFVMQRSGSVDRSDVIYFTTIKSMYGTAERDVRAMAISRATGRTVWYKWAGSAWRRQ